jgi:hypothetical protein
LVVLMVENELVVIVGKKKEMTAALVESIGNVVEAYEIYIVVKIVVENIIVVKESRITYFHK